MPKAMMAAACQKIIQAGMKMVMVETGGDSGAKPTKLSAVNPSWSQGILKNCKTKRAPFKRVNGVCSYPRKLQSGISR
ncbi:hypothetical protein ACVRZ8_05160 [Streptococcus dentiloxodontae]